MKLPTDFEARRDHLSKLLASWPRLNLSEATDDKGRPATLAYNMVEIEESCRRIVGLLESVDDEELDVEAFASSFREELRHIRYHVEDDEYLRIIL